MWERVTDLQNKCFDCVLSALFLSSNQSLLIILGGTCISQIYSSAILINFFIKYVYKPNMILVYSLKEYFFIELYYADRRTDEQTDTCHESIHCTYESH